MTFHGPGGEVDQLARGFETLDVALDALCGKLRDLNVQDTGPRETAEAFGDALTRLEQGLSHVASQAHDAAQVVRRYGDEEAS